MIKIVLFKLQATKTIDRATDEDTRCYPKSSSSCYT